MGYGRRKRALKYAKKYFSQAVPVAAPPQRVEVPLLVSNKCTIVKFQVRVRGLHALRGARVALEHAPGAASCLVYVEQLRAAARGEAGPAAELRCYRWLDSDADGRDHCVKAQLRDASVIRVRGLGNASRGVGRDGWQFTTFCLSLNTQNTRSAAVSERRPPLHRTPSRSEYPNVLSQTL